MEKDTECIIRACQAGDHEAQRQLYERFKDRVHGFVVRLVPLQDAADVTCEIFVRTFRSLKDLRRPERFLPWLYRICLNECLLHRRREKRGVRTQSLPEAVFSQAPEAGKRLEDQEVLTLAFQKLEPDFLVTFLLRESEELSYNEIASVMKVSEGTVASRLSRARRQLREALTELGGEF